VNYRPEYEHAWHRKTYYQQLRLDPLPADSAEELLGALLGEADELTPLKRVLIERTEGNPFFVEESVRTLVESGVLAGQRGSYRVARPFESAQVPATVQAVLAARIDRLAPEDKHLLQAAAVIGKDVPYPLLLAIADLSEDALRQRLARLHAAEFLYETSLFPDLEYTFKHALTHEVAYGSLLGERRRALHAQIVAAIERLYSSRLPEQVERLAHHAYRGEVWEKAAGYLRQAGTRAITHSAATDAIAHFEQALLALGHRTESRDAQLQALDARVDLAWALIRRGEPRQAMDYLREAETLAEALDDQPRLADILRTMTRQHWAAGEHDNAIESGQRALAIATALGDPDGQSRAGYGVALAHASRGNYARAIELFTDSLAGTQGYSPLARFELSGNVPMLASSWLAMCLAELGEFARGIVPGQDAVRIAEETDDPWSIAVACWALGHVHLRLGDVRNAIVVQERGWEVLKVVDSPGQVPNVAGGLGYAYTLAGRLGEGLPLLEQAVEQSPSVPRLVYLAEAYERAGRLDSALDTASRALDSAERHKEHGSEAWALRLLGEIAAHAAPPKVEQAEGYYGQALSLAEELGMRPLAAHCHLGLGTLYRKVGRDEQARAELATASEMYRAMGMTFWLEKAEAVRAQVGAGSP
jgi:tetratricopeptide (TPR) repeat protein